MVDFEDISYLKTGNERQQRAYEILDKFKVFELLKAFDPILVGTIPINIDIETSDLDIICCYPKKESFIQRLTGLFGDQAHFSIEERTELEAVVCGFWLDDFEIEIFGQNIPSKQQNGYCHMLVEYQLINERGEDFRQEIIALKRLGYKTEPAFAFALGIKGDPYEELLKLVGKTSGLDNRKPDGLT